jgi:hypothetical protein
LLAPNTLKMLQPKLRPCMHYEVSLIFDRVNSIQNSSLSVLSILRPADRAWGRWWRVIGLGSSLGIGGIFWSGGGFDGFVDVAREVLVADDGGSVG